MELSDPKVGLDRSTGVLWLRVLKSKAALAAGSRYMGVLYFASFILRALPDMPDAEPVKKYSLPKKTRLGMCGLLRCLP